MRLVENTFWQMLDQVIGRGLLFAFYLSIPLLIGLDEFGRFAFLQALTQLLIQPAFLLGLELLVVTGVARGDAKAIGNALAIRLLAFVATAAIVALLGLANAPADRLLLWLLWWYHGVMALQSLVFAHFRGIESMRLEAIVGMLQKALGCFVLALLALFGVGGALLPALALGIMGTIGIALLAGPFGRVVGPLLRGAGWPRPGDPALRAMLRDGTQLGVASFVGVVYFRLGSVMLGVLAGREAVGAYAIAFRVLEATLIVPNVTLNVTLPRLAKATVLRAAALRLALVLAVCGVVVSVVLHVAAESLIAAFYGDEFARAGAVLGVIALAVAPIFAGCALTQTLIALHRSGAYLRIAVASMFLNATLNLLLIPFWAETGAAVATVVTELMVVGMATRAVWSESSPRPLT